MNDLTTIRDLGAALDPQLRGPSPQLRHRVLTEFSAGPRRATPGLLRRNFARRPLLAASVTVALAAALLIAPVLRLLGPAPGASARAAGILRLAALAAQRQPALTIRPSQFIFVKSVESSVVTTMTRSGRLADARMYTQLRESWLSASGRRNGLVREQPKTAPWPGRPTGPWHSFTLPGCRGHVPALAPSRCPPYPGYLRNLPTSAAAMLAYLYRQSHGVKPRSLYAFVAASDLIRDSYARPAVMAALFEAVARIPGVSVVSGAVTMVGRHGIAVQITFAGYSHQLIFDRRSYAFIGDRDVAVSAASGLKAGTVTDSTAILRLAVVDRAGQLP